MNTHLHITAWALAFIFVFVVAMLHKQGKAKAAKILHMVLRLFYIIILISGVQLLWNYFHGSDYLVLALVKSFAGLWVIGAMEMVTVSLAKGRSARSGWIQLAIAFIVTLVLGFGVL